MGINIPPPKGLGFRVWGLWFWVSGLGFRVWGLGFKVSTTRTESQTCKAFQISYQIQLGEILEAMEDTGRDAFESVVPHF